MRITIEEIGANGLELRKELSRQWVDEALSEGRHAAYWAESPTELLARAEKVDDGVVLRGSLSPKLVTECRRCLKQVQLDLPVVFTLNLVNRERLGRRGEADDVEEIPSGSFDVREADREEFNGRTIELEPIVREQLLLALPMDALCRQDCQGLCASCGRDLNEARCDCKPAAPDEGEAQRPKDPRWEKLKGVKLSN